MKFISFASSSKGNCKFMSHKDTNILIDCGISRKRIVENLRLLNKTLDDIDCIFITHSHTDHILGLPMILKDSNVKVASQRKTLESIVSYCETKGTNIKTSNFKVLQPMNFEDTFSYININDIKVIPLKGSHDVPSLYYKIILGDKKVAILTDMGAYTNYTINSLLDVDYLMLECNYDEQMLTDNVNYSLELKNRIRSNNGHLSNVACSEMIMKLASGKIKEVYLSHISDENNSEEYALEFVKKYLKDNYKDEYKLPKINIAKRVEKTIIYDDD